MKPNTTANPTASHSEWFCAHLAREVGISLHPFYKIENLSGETWFGSQWTPGEIKDWWIAVLGGSVSLDDLKDDLSRIYAFDLFVHNVDRHVKNYIVRAEGAGHEIWALDHGRAWMFNGFPPPPLPLGPGTKTVAAREWMKANFTGFQSKIAMLEMIEKLKKVTDTKVQDIVNDEHPNWLDKSKKEDIVKWWTDGKALERLEVITKGVGDGSLL
jgi:hypothetical protein